MARRRARRAVRRVGRATRTVYRRAAPRRGGRRRNAGMSMARKAAIGAAAGLAISIPLTMLGIRTGRPELVEAGQRVGSVSSAHFGGTVGNAAYQGVDALFDRFVVVGGNNISGQGAAV